MNLQNPKFTLLAIGALFIAPLILAILMRSSWWNFEPSRFANRGILIEPPMLLPVGELDFQYSGTGSSTTGKTQWTLLYPIGPNCNESCLRDIVSLRQIHIAAGKNRRKIALWLLADKQISATLQARLIAVYPEFNLLSDVSGAVIQSLISISNDINTQKKYSDPGQVYLLDPAANIILRYTTGFDPMDIKLDLDRLLAWSAAY